MSLRYDPSVPVDQDGQKILYTGVEVYVKVLESLHVWMRANSMAVVLENDMLQIPRRPSNKVIRHVTGNRASGYERKEVAESR